MNHPPEAFDLVKLLGSIERETFFRDSWEKQPLAVSRHDPEYYRQYLFSRHDRGQRDRLWHCGRKFLEPDNFKPEAPPRSNFVRGRLSEGNLGGGYYPDLPEVHRAFAQGKTVIVDAVEHRWLAVATMCRHLEAFFGCPVQTNLYLTPPGAQGFAAHFDTHEVFVLQIDGEKHWRFYGVARELPLPSDQAPVQKDQLGPPTQEVFLKPGDLLYMPRGHVHEAFTSDRPSLHLTVGVMVFRWLDLLRQALAAAGAADVRFRQSLPAGTLCKGVTPPALSEKFQELLQLFANGAQPETGGRGQGRGVCGKAGRACRRITLPSTIPTKSRWTPPWSAPQESFAGSSRRATRSILHRARRRHRWTGQDRSGLALHRLRNHRLTPRDLPDNLTQGAKLVLVRRLIREKLLTVVDPSADAPGEF